MSDLRPILEDDATEDEERILRSARLDVPPRDGKNRTLAALGVAAAMATAAGTSGASAASGGAGFMIKWMAVGALGGTVALGAAGSLTPLVRGLGHPGPAPLAPVATAAIPQAAPRLTAAPSTPEIVSVRPPDTGAPEEPPRPSAPQVAQAPAVSTIEPIRRTTQTSLAAEVSALDDARRALASGDVDSAFHVLDDYDRRFVRRRLGPEATVLRIESLLARGASQEAHELGDALLAAQPDGPYAQHVRSLLSETDR